MDVTGSEIKAHFAQKIILSYSQKKKRWGLIYSERGDLKTLLKLLPPKYMRG